MLSLTGNGVWAGPSKFFIRAVKDVISNKCFVCRNKVFQRASDGRHVHSLSHTGPVAVWEKSGTTRTWPTEAGDIAVTSCVMMTAPSRESLRTASTMSTGCIPGENN